jgi:acetyl-CoA carboxylase beta subunit
MGGIVFSEAVFALVIIALHTVVIQDLDLVGRIYIAVFIIPLCDRFT